MNTLCPQDQFHAKVGHTLDLLVPPSKPCCHIQRSRSSMLDPLHFDIILHQRLTDRVSVPSSGRKCVSLPFRNIIPVRFPSVVFSKKKEVESKDNERQKNKISLSLNNSKRCTKQISTIFRTTPITRHLRFFPNRSPLSLTLFQFFYMQSFYRLFENILRFFLLSAEIPNSARTRVFFSPSMRTN